MLNTLKAYKEKQFNKQFNSYECIDNVLSYLYNTTVHPSVRVISQRAFAGAAA